ncbi:MAG: hypothetical protein JNM55_21560 [Anaerolineales bacterium]|nr:hypothetical protein [Anaerolineales bacterium]
MNPFLEIRRYFTQVFRLWRGETSLSDFGLKEILIGVGLISLATATSDMLFWLKVSSYTVWLVTFLLWFIYLLSLCVSTAFLLSQLVPNGDFRQALAMTVCVYWVIPFVPPFSLLPWEKAWGLGNFATIPVFRMIPTFLVENNYLPLGMLVVIPFILWMASRFMAQTTGVTWSRVFIMTLVAYGVIYVYYYQWSQQALVTALFHKGFFQWRGMLAAYVTYCFLSQLITFLLSPVIARAYREYPLWVHMLWSGIPLAVFLLIPRFGFLPLFLVNGRP